MTIAEIIAIIILSVLIGVVFYYGFRRTGPWGSFWSFLLILFLGMWLFDVWVTPFGPIYWGVAWLDLLLVGFLLALLLAAASPTPPPGREQIAPDERKRVEGGQAAAAAVIGTFFWLLMLMFVVLLLLGIFA